MTEDEDEPDSQLIFNAIRRDNFEESDLGVNHISEQEGDPPEFIKSMLSKLHQPRPIWSGHDQVQLFLTFAHIFLTPFT
jgi:hypothetical protein